MSQIHLATALAFGAYLIVERLFLPGNQVMVRALPMIEVTCRISLVVVAPKSSLLSTYRNQQELFWRTILGAVVSLPTAVCVQIVYSVANIFVYAKNIPDGLIHGLAWQRIGVYSSTQCAEFFSADQWAQVTNLIGYVGHVFPNTDKPSWRFIQAFQVSESGLGRTAFSDFVSGELMVFAVVVAVLWIFQHLMIAELRYFVCFRDAEGHAAAVASLFTRLCDCTVHLDSDFQIGARAPQLVALMHCHSSQEMLRGESFLRFIPEEDHDRVQTHIRGDPTADGAQCETLYACLLDVLNIKVFCQIFCARLTSMDGQTSYIVGLNEIGERGDAFDDRANETRVSQGLAHMVGSQTSCIVGLNEIGERGNAFSDSAEETRVSQGLAQMVGSQTSESAEASDSDSSASGQSNILREVTFHGPTGKIKTSSPGFDNLLGKSAVGKSLGKVLRGTKPFLNWLDEALVSIYASSAPQLPTSRTYTGQLLRRRSSINVRVEVLFPQSFFESRNFEFLAKVSRCPRNRPRPGVPSITEGRPGPREVGRGQHMAASSSMPAAQTHQIMEL